MLGKRGIATAVTLLFWCTVRVQGGIVTWTFGGQIDRVNDAHRFFGGIAEPGTPFQGTLTFDTAAEDLAPDSLNTGRYDGGLQSIELTIGTSDLPLIYPLTLHVEDDHPTNGDVWSVLGFFFYNGTFAQFSWVLDDLDGTMFGSDLLAATPPILSVLESADMAIEKIDSFSRPRVSGSLTSLVPEPSTSLLLGILACAVGIPRVFRRPRQSVRGWARRRDRR